MTAGLDVLAPLAGTVLPLARVDDPVFSTELVGPGLALAPDLDGPSRVVAPIGGTVVKLHPHAFVVQGGDGRAVLVHLGINTVQLEGKGFDLRVAEGDAVDPRGLESDGHRTSPPPRFTEASLIKALEERGIGRPSTYAATISVIQDRGYVTSRGQALVPSWLAFAVLKSTWSPDSCSARTLS